MSSNYLAPISRSLDASLLPSNRSIGSKTASQAGATSEPHRQFTSSSSQMLTSRRAILCTYHERTSWCRVSGFRWRDRLLRQRCRSGCADFGRPWSSHIRPSTRPSCSSRANSPVPYGCPCRSRLSRRRGPDRLRCIRTGSKYLRRKIGVNLLYIGCNNWNDTLLRSLLSLRN